MMAPSVRIPKPFLDLVQGDLRVLNQVFNGFHRIITGSFAPGAFPMRGNRRPPVSEVKRRFDICERITRMLRNDHQWGWSRILDRLPEYLGCELSGKPWEPDRRSVWIPEDGR